MKKKLVIIIAFILLLIMFLLKTGFGVIPDFGVFEKLGNIQFW